MEGYNTTIDTELNTLVKKVNKLGINVIKEDDHVSSQCLTVVLDSSDDNKKEMIAVIDGKESPFSWRLGVCEFKRWARIATSYPYNKINKQLARIVRLMNTDAFNELRQHRRLETEFLEMLYAEMGSIGVPAHLNRGVIIRLMLIYGGLVDQSAFMEDFLIEMFGMILKGSFKINKCRSCKYCDISVKKGAKHKCKAPGFEGFKIPGNMMVEGLLKDVPDFSVVEVGDERVCMTKYILDMQKTCEHYRRRF